MPYIYFLKKTDKYSSETFIASLFHFIIDNINSTLYN